MDLTFAVAYGGRQEIIDAVQAMLRERTSKARISRRSSTASTRRRSPSTSTRPISRTRI
jgi:undecaprenyl pyrophosphate synthase